MSDPKTPVASETTTLPRHVLIDLLIEVQALAAVLSLDGLDELADWVEDDIEAVLRAALAHRPGPATA